MLDINLEWYRCFYWVAKTGSLTAAAERLHITQPAVSHTIKQLEARIGGPLFFRASRGVTLTKEGEVLRQYMEQAFTQIANAERAMADINQLNSGEIRIGASDTLCKHYLLPYLRQFHTRYPEVRIHVTNRTTPDTISLLKKGDIDFGIVGGPAMDKLASGTPVRDQLAADKLASGTPARNQLAADKPASGTPAPNQLAAGKPAPSTPARDQPATDRPAPGTPVRDQPALDKQVQYRPSATIQDCLLAGADYAELAAAPLPLSRLLDYPVLMLEPGSSTRHYLDRYAASCGIALKPEFELGSIDLLVQFARHGFGLAFAIREFVPEDLLHSGELAAIQLDPPPPPRTIGVATLQGVPLSAAARAFVAMLA